MKPPVNPANPSEEVMVHNGVLVNLYPEQVMCDMECTVKLSIREGEQWMTQSEYSFHKRVVINKNFHICFRNLSGAKMFLEKDVSFKLDLRFATPHPLWLRAGSWPARGKDLSVKEGILEENGEVSSHVRYVLYKPYSPELA